MWKLFPSDREELTDRSGNDIAEIDFSSVLTIFQDTVMNFTG